MARMDDSMGATRPSGEIAVPSAQLPERYQLGARLGAGGMGEVVLATDTQIGRDVAIKRMRVAASPAAVARFVREAKIQGKLDHPAIVPVHELGTDADGQPFFVMKRLAGTTLADVIAAGETSRAKLLRAFADVCLAVELAHTRGIVHRDLKPANVMLGDFGEVYVLDWGVARITGETDDAEPASASGDGVATEVGAILGTPGYIAPEVFGGQVADARADVYALGCILFEILTGAAMVGRSTDAFVEAPESARHPALRASDRDIPPELDAVCVDATATDPAARLRSARACADRIERFLDGDRDTAQRKRLAADHLSRARAAIASGRDEAERATAMREAGRALALDPTSGAADIIGSLMLEPPRTQPREVAERIAQIEGATARDKTHTVSIIVMTYAAFVPLLLWIGVRDMAWIWLFLVCTAIDGGYAWAVTRTRRSSPTTSIYIGIAINAVVTGMLARMFSPLLVAPGIAAVSMMMFAVDMRLRVSALAAMAIASVFVPWLLELAGVFSRTISAANGTLVIQAPAIDVHLPAAEVTLAVYALALIVLAGIASRRVGQATRAALATTELQAWHLRQLTR